MSLVPHVSHRSSCLLDPRWIGVGSRPDRVCVAQLDLARDSRNAAAFAGAGDAVAAAMDAQQALGDEAWPEPVVVRVRMGLHTGQAEERGGDYFGSTLNRAARVMAAGHGGQILVSQSTAGLCDDVELVDLGKRRLKDLSGATRLFQVCGPGLQGGVRCVAHC